MFKSINDIKSSENKLMENYFEIKSYYMENQQLLS
jgi:hypothetical protein